MYELETIDESKIYMRNIFNQKYIYDQGSIPVSGRVPREGNGNLFQYSCLENPTDRGAWRLWPMGSQSQTRLK